MTKKNPHLAFYRLKACSGRMAPMMTQRPMRSESVLAYKLEEAMKAQNLSKARMSKRMETGRSQLDCLLDPENEGVTLHTLRRAAAAVGMHLELELRQH